MTATRKKDAAGVKKLTLKKIMLMRPGEVLREEFLAPLKISVVALAKACGLPRTRIERIAGEQTGIIADAALRLSKALGTRSFGSICRMIMMSR